MAKVHETSRGADLRWIWTHNPARLYSSNHPDIHALIKASQLCPLDIMGMELIKLRCI